MMPPRLVPWSMLAALSLAIAACSSGGTGGADMNSCKAPNVLRYEGPGCGPTAPAPVCGDPVQDACLGLVCSCAGRVIGGCDYWAEPWARRIRSLGAQSGDPCDPSATDAALPQPVTCGDKTCVANELCLFICDCCGFPSDMAASHWQCVPDQGQCNVPDPEKKYFSGAPYAMFPCRCQTQRTASCPCV